MTAIFLGGLSVQDELNTYMAKYFLLFLGQDCKYTAKIYATLYSFNHIGFLRGPCKGAFLNIFVVPKELKRAFKPLLS
jgi:hypothetical protein